VYTPTKRQFVFATYSVTMCGEDYTEVSPLASDVPAQDVGPATSK
jgi:hypothetical protein